jgi:hypothetical protein
VGPSGQCHCRPAPHPGWLPWAALSRCTPRGYLDAAIRCRLASPLTPPRQRGSEANRLAAVSEADRVAARGLKPCATAAVPASKRRPHTTSARLSRCQLAVAYSFLPGHHRSPCWCRSPPLFLGGRWSSGCRSSRQAAVLHRHRACSRWARVTGECRTALSSAVGRPVPPPRDVAPPRRRARAVAWALRSGHLARWAASLPRAWAAPDKTVGRVRCASRAVQHCANGLRRHCGRGLCVTVPLGHGGFGPVAFDLFFYFMNIFKSL